MHHALIPMWFVIAALFVPRITLIIAFLAHQIPYNDVPVWGNVVLALLLPRLLIIIYLYEHHMYMWCGIHAFVMLLVWGGGSSSMRKQRSGF
jgi:hypothetical protein